jgi:hypothetical protein
MRQQGLYLGAVRQLKPAERAKVKAMSAEGTPGRDIEARKLAKRG